MAERCDERKSSGACSSQDLPSHGSEEVPERVREMLQGAKSFGELRGRRVRSVLHLFSCAMDVLGNVIYKEAVPEGLTLDVTAVYFKVGKAGILEDGPVHEDLGERRRARGTVFMTGLLAARFRRRGGSSRAGTCTREGPEIYSLSLSSNKAAQQKPADEGALLAGIRAPMTRALELVGADLADARFQGGSSYDGPWQGCGRA